MQKFLMPNYFVCLKFCCLLCYSCPTWDCVQITYLLFLLPSEQQCLCSGFCFLQIKICPHVKLWSYPLFLHDCLWDPYWLCYWRKVPVAHSQGDMPAFIYIWKQASTNLSDSWLYKLFLKLYSIHHSQPWHPYSYVLCCRALSSLYLGLGC